MLFAPWAPHLNLPFRVVCIDQHTKSPLRQERHQASSRRQPKPADAAGGDPEQSTKRQRQEEIPRAQSLPASSSCAAADTSMQILDPQIPKPVRQLSPAEREDSIQKRQRPADVNTVLAIAGGLQRKHIRILDRRSESIAHSLVWWKSSTCHNHNKVSQHVGCRINGWTELTTCELVQEAWSQLSVLMLFFQESQSSRLCEVFSPLLQSTEAEAQVDSSKEWLCKNALQGLKISPQSWSIHTTQKINDLSYDQLVSDPSAYVKKRNSILLRRMDDVSTAKVVA